MRATGSAAIPSLAARPASAGHHTFPTPFQEAQSPGDRPPLISHRRLPLYPSPPAQGGRRSSGSFPLMREGWGKGLKPWLDVTPVGVPLNGAKILGRFSSSLSSNFAGIFGFSGRPVSGSVSWCGCDGSPRDHAAPGSGASAIPKDRAPGPSFGGSNGALLMADLSQSEISQHEPGKQLGLIHTSGFGLNRRKSLQSQEIR